MSKSERILTCDRDDIRLDTYLSETMPEVSRAYFQKLIKEEKVLVNGTAVHKNHRMKNGDAVHITMEGPVKSGTDPQDIPLDVIYEDGDIIVVNKAKGMVVHPAPGNRDKTLVNALLYHCRDSLSDINGIERPGIVHRIDKDTSGLLVAAKTNKAHRGLSAMLGDHLINREYLAVVAGTIHENDGIIDAPVGRHPKHRTKMAVNVKNGKRAVSRFHVLQRFSKATYVRVALETGRTHQIRVHMAYIGHPVLGDQVYGPGKPERNLQGQALHAVRLSFPHPVTGEDMSFEAPVPEYFRHLLEELTNE
ncbi:MAG: RluA family pseudouridine synthase [Clostridia bacterium]